jgi:hypothetical protein
MKVSTRNTERTILEMSEMWYWMTTNFGPPEPHNHHMQRWTYGKDHPGFMGSETIDGTFDIEWFDFRDKKDAEWFVLRWS